MQCPDSAGVRTLHPSRVLSVPTLTMFRSELVKIVNEPLTPAEFDADPRHRSEHPCPRQVTPPKGSRIMARLGRGQGPNKSTVGVMMTYKQLCEKLIKRERLRMYSRIVFGVLGAIGAAVALKSLQDDIDSAEE